MLSYICNKSSHTLEPVAWRTWGRLLCRFLLVVVASIFWGQALAQKISMTEARDVFNQAETLFSEGRLEQAKPLYQKVLSNDLQHRPAYGRLVEMAIKDRDAATLEQLMAAHRAYLYAAPESFRVRVQYYELNILRKLYNNAAKAIIARRWEAAIRGFSQLLGEEPYHSQAVKGLFHVAMKQKDFASARLIAQFADTYGNDHPAGSVQLLSACALQRSGENTAALEQIRQALVAYGAASESSDTRLEAQRAVYLGMIRLEVELNQCFMYAMNSLEQGHALFPDLPDGVLNTLARNRGERADTH